MAYYTGVHRTQFDGSIYAAENCNPTSIANGARASSGGKIDKSGGQVRAIVKRSEETNPATAGWSLEDAKLACDRMGVAYTIHRGTWSDIIAFSNAGHFVHVQGDSDQFPNGTCSGTFNGDHSVGLHPNVYNGLRLLADPICKTTRYESETVLRNYAQKYANNTTNGVIRCGVFSAIVPNTGTPDVIPQEVSSLKIINTKGEDWTPDVTRRPYRANPIRSSAIIGYIEFGQIVRTIVEASTPDGNGWRLTEVNNKPVWLLRSDFNPLTQGGDPVVDQGLTNYINRV